MTARPRLLLVAEAATFAHVARIAVIRKALRSQFHVQAAFDGRFDHYLDAEDRDHLPLFTVPTSEFTADVNRSRFPYDEADLTRYVEEDLSLFATVRPDLVVGDFRLSLAISCAIAKVRYLPLVNGYWTPACREPPIAPRVRPLLHVPRRLGALAFALLRPLAFQRAARPFNRVAKAYGVPDAQGDLLHVYAQRRRALVAEPEGWLRLDGEGGLVPIGALGWASSRPLPAWWGEWDLEATVVHVSLGSSGDASQLDRVCEVLGRRRPLVAVVAGKVAAKRRVGRATVYSSPFLNSHLALQQSHLFVSNGGSLSLVDALRSGCPVVGIASNYDQVLNMAAVERHGVGSLVFADDSTATLERSCEAWLDPTPEKRRALLRARGVFAGGLASSRLMQTVRSLLAGESSTLS